LTAQLSFRVVADTPPPFSYDTARVSKRMLPSPNLERLGRWILSFTRLHLRSLSLRPGNLLTPLYGALSMGFKRQRFPHLLPSSYMALAFCHGGTCTRKCVRPFAGHAKKVDLTLLALQYASPICVQKTLRRADVGLRLTLTLTGYFPTFRR